MSKHILLSSLIDLQVAGLHGYAITLSPKGVGMARTRAQLEGQDNFWSFEIQFPNACHFVVIVWHWS